MCVHVCIFLLLGISQVYFKKQSSMIENRSLRKQTFPFEPRICHCVVLSKLLSLFESLFHFSNLYNDGYWTKLCGLNKAIHVHCFAWCLAVSIVMNKDSLGFQSQRHPACPTVPVLSTLQISGA